MTERLFDPGPAVPDPYEGMSDGARRTAQQRDLLAAGVHPATRLPLADAPHGGAGETCGTCQRQHTYVHRSGARFHKCALAGETRSAATDIRLGWPACVRWVARPARRA